MEIIILFSISRKVFFFFKSSEVSKIEDRLCFFFFSFSFLSFLFLLSLLNWRLECYGVVGNSGGTVMKMKL